MDKIIYKRTTILKSVLKQLVCQKIFRTTDDLTAILLQHSLTQKTRTRQDSMRLVFCQTNYFNTDLKKRKI